MNRSRQRRAAKAEWFLSKWDGVIIQEKSMLTLNQLANPALLTLAAKKAYRHLDRHSWFFDRADATKFCSRLAFNVQRLSEALQAGTYQPACKLMFPAPKRIEIRSDESIRYIVRPLCAYSFRDQVLDTALVCLFADYFESDWGDARRPVYPKLMAYGNRLHRVGKGPKSSFSLGSSRLYRDWSDDYSAFVRETERAFNGILRGLGEGQRAVLLCCDVKSFYPTVRRDRLAKLLLPACDPSLAAVVGRIFGRYNVEKSKGLPVKEARNLRIIGLPQGAVHSGFWSNAYLAEFDNWVREKLGSSVAISLPEFRLTFYARYVDDMRFVGYYPVRVGAPHRKATAHPLHRVVVRKLKSYGLQLSSSKSRLIAQGAGGTLLTTGQIAERMQNLKERLYMPLPPEDLDEAAKDLRLLFHAELPIPASGKGLGAPHFDNPGVRTDSRRRFAAGKWIQVAKEMEKLSVGWKDRNREFASELVRSWLEKPEQVLLLHYALQIGLTARETSEIVRRMRKLESDPHAYSYFAYVAAYFLDQSSRRGGNTTMQGKLPLGSWAKSAVRSVRAHPVFLNKARQYLITMTNLTAGEAAFFLKGNNDGFCQLLRCSRDGIKREYGLHPTEVAALLSAPGFEEQRLLVALKSILIGSDAEIANVFLRQLLLNHTKNKQLTGIVNVARNAGFKLSEFKVFHQIKGPPPQQRPEPLYRAILRGTFRSPLAWCILASRLASFLRRPDAAILGARGLLHPFALTHAPDGTLALSDNPSPNLAFAGYAGRFGSLTGFDSTYAWCLPVGMLLHAAATEDHRSLLGFSNAQRFRTLSALQPLLKNGGQLPEAAGEILMRLFTWPGSRIRPFADIADFGATIEGLHARIKTQTAPDGISICDVRGPSMEAANEPFSVVLCQVPSNPITVSDITIRRALAVARLIGRERSAQNRPPQLVVFPELSVPVASLPTLCRFVQATGAIVLAGLELHASASGHRQLNELIWIVPTGDEDTRPLVLRQHKIHVTQEESKLLPPVTRASPAVIWRIGTKPKRLTAINCYEFTDLTIRQLLRGRIEALVIAANNRDVPTFDNLVESTHYDLFCHVILVNTNRFGGSAIRAPYREPYHRRIFDIHGNDLFAVNLCELDISVFRNCTSLAPGIPSSGSAVPRPIKTRPAGFVEHP